LEIDDLDFRKIQQLLMSEVKSTQDEEVLVELLTSLRAV
jgi:hypothetical protein